MALAIDMQMGLFLLDGIVRATAGPAQICQRSESEEPGSYGGHGGVGVWWVGVESAGGTCGESPPSLFPKGGTFKNKQITTEKTRAKLTPPVQTIQSTMQEEKKIPTHLFRRGKKGKQVELS